MKKLALAIAVAAISGQAAAVELYSSNDATLDVYGQLRTRLQKTNNEGENKFDVASSRIGAIGTYKLSDDLTASGKIQVKYADDGKTNFYSDVLWVGLNSKTLGNARIGSMYTIWDEEQGMHDFTYNFGGSAKMGDNVYGTAFLKNVLDYSMDLGQVKLRAQYLMSPMDRDAKNRDLSFSGLDTKAKIDKSHSFGATWNSDFGLSVAGTYSATKIDKTTEDADTSYGETESLGLTASYSINSLTIGTQLSRITAEADNKADFDQTKKGFGLGAQYSFANGMNPYFTYDNAKEDTKGNDAVDETTKSYVVGVEFKPNSSVRVWTEVGKTKVDRKDDKDTSSTAWAIGARYYF